MDMQSSVLLFCLLIVVFPFPSNAQPPSYDYFQVVFQWPRSLCSPPVLRSKCVTKVPNFFTLHGLWPDKSGKPSTPKNCIPPVTFASPNAAQAADLQKCWPSILLKNSDMGFWEHEWKKHGSCAAPIVQNQYFGMAIRLYNDIDLQKILFNLPKPTVGLQSGANNTFDVSAAIFAKHRVLPILRCKDHNGYKQLNEVIICYDGHSYINCSATPTRHPPKGSLRECPKSYYLA